MKYQILGGVLITGVYCETTTEIGKTTPTWEQILAIVGIVLIVVALIVYLIKRRAPSLRQILQQYTTQPSQAEITFVKYKNNNDLQIQAVLQTSHTIDKSVEDKNYVNDDQQLSIVQNNGKETRDLSEVFKKKSGSKQNNSKKRLASGARIVKSAVEVNTNSLQDNQI